MNTTAFDSFLFRDMFSTPAMRDVFSDSAFVAKMTDAETALARAQASVGVIPLEAAQQITDQVRPADLDQERLRIETANVGYPVLPLVTQLAEQCGDAGGYLHWGATTQDIMDTATMLQCREGLDLIAAALDRVRETLRRLAAAHADTITAGRTHLQHALPITFGYWRRCLGLRTRPTQ